MRKILVIITVLTSIFTVSPALAFDNTWITYPTLSSVTLVGPNVHGYVLSTQSTGIDLKFSGGSAQANKFAQINFYDFVGTVRLQLEASLTGVSSTACERQVLGGDSHTCFFRLDGSGKASLHLELAGTSKASNFKFKVLAGPNIQESQSATVTFQPPTNKIAAVYPYTRGLTGGPGVVFFKVTQDGKASKDILVKFSFSGIGQNLSNKTGTSNAQGLVAVYLTNLKWQTGYSTITAKILGGSAKASGKIHWHKVSFGDN
jgi:hypothetical protein